MSGYEEHFTVGLIVTVLAGALMIYLGYLELSSLNIFILLGISFVFSLLPDIDIGTSMIRRVFIVFFVVFLFVKGLTLMGYILGIILLLVQFLHHRGIMHSLVIGVLLSGMLYFISHSWAFPIIALLNFASHLFLDRR
jgi:membrane-bound metal-dependent hydrolase YbcI (DUF457 family)